MFNCTKRNYFHHPQFLPKSTIVHYEFYAQTQKPGQSVKIRIDRFGKFGCRHWPWTSAVLKGSLIIVGLKLTLAKDTKCTLENQAPWRFFLNSWAVCYARAVEVQQVHLDRKTRFYQNQSFLRYPPALIKNPKRCL